MATLLPQNILTLCSLLFSSEPTLFWYRMINEFKAGTLIIDPRGADWLGGKVGDLWGEGKNMREN